jgi:Lon protease-like protein
MARTLPVFPLNTVMFPGGALELRIFEPRHKAMLKNCLDSDRRFVISLIKRGEEVGGRAEPYTVGTVVRVDEIGSPTRGGLPIKVIGERRVRLRSLDSNSQPYLIAQAEPFDDIETLTPASDLLRASRDAVATFISRLFAARGIWSSGLQVPEDPIALSYFMGIISPEAPAKDRQKLLETDSLGARLAAGIALLEQESSRIQSAIMRAGPGAMESRFSTN